MRQGLDSRDQVQARGLTLVGMAVLSAWGNLGESQDPWLLWSHTPPRSGTPCPRGKSLVWNSNSDGYQAGGRSVRDCCLQLGQPHEGRVPVYPLFMLQQ